MNQIKTAGSSLAPIFELCFVKFSVFFLKLIEAESAWYFRHRVDWR
jgi:hypothetical protein